MFDLTKVDIEGKRKRSSRKALEKSLKLPSAQIKRERNVSV